MTRLLFVSHAASVAVNQAPYASLLERGVDVHVIVPHLWRHELGTGDVGPIVLPDLVGRVHTARIARPGSIQRHVHLTPPGRWLRRLDPDVVLVDEEHFGIPAAQWVLAARRRRIPVAVNAWENLDRPLPWPARVLRWATLRAATGIFARTPAAGRRVRGWGARGVVHVVPPAVGAPTLAAARSKDHDAPFTVGYAGRLVEAKGVLDLLAAVDQLGGEVRLLVAGDGPLRDRVASHPGVDLRTGVGHDDMPAIYADMDVLVLPSRTTPTWAEQLGRVLLEAMAAGRPVIASDSGEMPWVLEVARGGAIFPEGDVAALAAHLADVRARPEHWAEVAERGRQDVAERFSADASATAFLELVALMGQ